MTQQRKIGNSDKSMTAVEWLESTFYTYAESFGINNDKWGINELKLEDIVDKAKEMEKEQIIDAHLTGLIHPLETEATKQAEQYYNETFGNK